MRKRPEWIGKTDNHMPPASVRQRILDRENSTCHVCGGKIDKPGWHADHVPPLKDGGENRESMIRPAHERCHRILTAKQAEERAPVERIKLKHTGAKQPKGSFARAPKQERGGKAPLPPRVMFWPITGHSESGD